MRLWSNHQNPGHILSPALFQPTSYKVIHINTATPPKALRAKWQGQWGGGGVCSLFWGGVGGWSGGAGVVTAQGQEFVYLKSDI